MPPKTRKATSTSTRRLPTKKGSFKRKQVKDGAIEGVIIKNCHACKRQGIVELTCEQCELSFCVRHLVERYNVALDVVTRRWPCPRCTFLCDCANCTNFYKKIGLGDHERESRTRLEKECESFREELQRLHIEVERNVEMYNVMKEHNSTLQQLNESLQQINFQLQADLKSAKDSTKEACKRSVDKAEKISSVEDTCSSHIDDPLHKNEELAAVNKKLEEKCLSQREEISVLQIELAAAKEQMKETCSSHIDDQLQKNEELATVNKKLEEKCWSQNEEISVLHIELAAVKQQLKMAENEVYAGERLRKEMNDTIIELKGNLRVFCRVRPVLSDEGHGAESTLSYPAGLAGRRIDLTRSKNGETKKHSFTFDKLFGQDASQEKVFLEISDLVQSALDGSRVCIFAYGQTGSGKTHTMVGKPEDPNQKGLIPRSIEKVFETSKALAAQGWNYTLHLSILEVHNNTIKDLIDSESGVRGKKQKHHNIRQDVDGNTIVDGLTVRNVSTTHEVYKLLTKATKTRSVARTDLNMASSRSHLVFTLRIVGENETTNEKVQGFLYLVDLAGSEDPSQSGAVGETLQETKAINLSLCNVKSVILAISNKANSIPHRGCKLTFLLQDCFKRGSKTLMIVNVSPSPSSSGETLRSLQFAQRANSCEIGSSCSIQNLETSAAPPRPSPWLERSGGLGPRGGIPSEIGTPKRLIQNLETRAPPRSASWQGRSVGRGRIPPREQNAETLKRKVKPDDTNRDCLEILTGEKNTADLLKDVTRYSRRELEVACEGFNSIIHGNLSDWIVVFKGNMEGGPEIAVLSLNNQEEHWTSHLELYFKKEVANLARLNHENIGKLIGYCIEGVPFTRMLVFEYASNGTLSEHLHYEDGYQAALSWRSRMNIIRGLSKGLKYLHKEIEPPFTVYELNSSAVYLRGDFSPKLVDFESWKTILTRSESNEGAICVQPSSLQARHLDIHGNMYSFGVLLLEIVTGRPQFCKDKGSLVDWAKDYLEVPEKMASIVDPALKQHFRVEDLDTIWQAIRSCIHARDMQNLFETLESKLDTTVSSELKASSLAWVEPTLSS